MSLRSRARGSERGSHLQQSCGYNADMLNTRLACQNGDIHWCGDMRRRVVDGGNAWRRGGECRVTWSRDWGSQGPLDRSLYAVNISQGLSPRPDLFFPTPTLPIQSHVPSLQYTIYTDFTMSSNDNRLPRSLPIPIGHARSRSGSDSDSSSSDSGSVSPASPVQTPASGALPRVAPISPSTSPILSYFLSNQSPKSPPNATFPFRRGMAGPPLFEGTLCTRPSQENPELIRPIEDETEADRPIPRHGRRASAAAWPGHDRFPPVAPVPNDKQERAAGLLRRLSLGGNMAKVCIRLPCSLYLPGERWALSIRVQSLLSRIRRTEPLRHLAVRRLRL